VANYNNDADWNGQNGNVTTVGSAGANNFFGTADMSGNVREWNDAVIASSRGLRGGSWGSVADGIVASNRGTSLPTTDFGGVGFRVASIPEPSAYLFALLSASLLLARRHRSTF